MKKWNLICFVFLSLIPLINTSAQKQIILNSQAVNNQLDSVGFKQGFWVEYDHKIRKYYILINSMTIGGGETIMIKKEDTIYNEFDFFYCGIYKDNKKDGRWLKINNKMQIEYVVQFIDGYVIYFETYNPEGYKSNIGRFDTELNKMVIQSFDLKNNIIKNDTLDRPSNLFD